jgi:retinol dehydrogenase-12
MGYYWSQFFPPKPTFTESSLPDLKGRVYIVTGASAGIGKELARLLYSRNGTVYLAARSSDKANAAIAWIKETHPSSQGTARFLKLDLGDLTTIKRTAQEFLSQENRLDVLFNNAGVMIPPKGSKTTQGYELQLGTNCVGPFLLTKLLTPTLLQTAKIAPAGSVRVAWTSSGAADAMAPKGGVDVTSLGAENNKGAWGWYGVSKGGNVLHALEMQRRYGGEGVLSIVSLLPILHLSTPP